MLSKSGTAVVKILPPAAKAPAVTYTVVALPAAGGEPISVVTKNTTVLLTGLAPGKEYKFFAMESVSGSSSALATVAVLPLDPPVLTSLLPAGDGSIKAAWRAPLDDGGSPILSYTLACTGSKGAKAAGAAAGRTACLATPATALEAEKLHFGHWCGAQGPQKAAR